MYRYKLVQKADPRDKSKPKKWYATPLSITAQDIKTTTRSATANTTTAPIEMEASLELIANHAIERLPQGSAVKLGKLGTLRITFKSEGVEDINQFNSLTMIKEPRILFTPSKELREAVIKGLQFQNAGVLQDGVDYASLSAYKKAKGITDGTGTGTGTGTGGGGGSDPSENPLG